VGDLILIFGDDIKRTWKQITDHQSTGEIEHMGSSAPVVFEKQEVPEIALGVGDLLVRDERGVRLARQDEDEGGD
ncbi:MAG: hypothetical protein GY856_13015, partial [bacterium]|nr:hypothetical protein [bacterium]